MRVVLWKPSPRRRRHRARAGVTNFSGDDHSDRNTYSGAEELPPVPEVTDDDEVLRWDMQPGDALLLPAYWYHQVDSFAPPGKLNVAVNFWFQGHSLATRLYRTLRENLFINCTEPAAPGVAHPCR